MEYTLVFDTVKAGYSGWLYPLGGLAIGGVGGVAIALGQARVVARAPRSALDKWQQPKRDRLPAAFFGFVVCFSMIMSISDYRDYHLAWAAERDGTAQTLEGIVKDFKPVAAHERSMESFCVQNRCFSYSHGGIREGTKVRIQHLGDEIIRLEVAKDASTP